MTRPHDQHNGQGAEREGRHFTGSVGLETAWKACPDPGPCPAPSPVTAPAPDHEIVWGLEDGVLRPTVICNLDLDADCHREPQCECEVWFNPVRDSRGVIVGHLVTTYDDESDEEVEVTHPNVPAAECGLVLWLMQDPSVVAELTDEPSLVIGRTAITTAWDGGEVTWSAA